MKIIVGAKGTTLPGFISLEKADLDITCARMWAKVFGTMKVDVIVAEHVFEHLSESEAEQAARLCYQYLIPGGILRVAVPDGNHYSAEYIAHVRAGNLWNNLTSEPHRQMFTRESLSALLESVGFDVEPLQFYSDNVFYSRGYVAGIRRQAGAPSTALLSLLIGAPYTSLIMDGVKH